MKSFPAKLTVQDFINSGYSLDRATVLAANTPLIGKREMGAVPRLQKFQFDSLTDGRE